MSKEKCLTELLGPLVFICHKTPGFPKSSRSTLSRENTGGYHHDLTYMLNSTVNAVDSKVFFFKKTIFFYLPSAGCFRATRKPQSSSVKRKCLNLWTMGALLQCLFFFFFGSSRKRPTSPESSKSTSSGENPACPHIILQFSDPPHILERHSSAVGVLGWTGTSKLMLLLLPKP